MTNTIGVCCFCNDDCSSYSQCCKTCARSMTGVVMGWDIPVTQEHPSVKPIEIYYTGIGSKPDMQVMSETYFREILTLNVNNFNEMCPYDIKNCDINLLLDWSGATIV